MRAFSFLSTDRHVAGGRLLVALIFIAIFAEAPRDEAMRFGIKGRAPSNSPIVIALGEWRHLFADLCRASGLRQKLAVLFGPP